MFVAVSSFASCSFLVFLLLPSLLSLLPTSLFSLSHVLQLHLLKSPNVYCHLVRICPESFSLHVTHLVPTSLSVPTFTRRLSNIFFLFVFSCFSFLILSPFSSLLADKMSTLSGPSTLGRIGSETHFIPHDGID